MTKLEEVARAIHAACEPWNKFEIDEIEWFKVARAVIQALREPSGAMIKAGQPWAVGNAPPNCWIKMIDAILQEKQ